MDSYLVFGVYHLFQSINLKMHENREIQGNIYILDVFQGAEDYKKKVEESGIFNNTYFINKDMMENNKRIPNDRKKAESIKEKIISKIYNLFNHNLLLSDRIYKDTPLYKMRYDRLFTYGNYQYLDRFILYHCIKKDVKNYCVENGLGTRVKNTSSAGLVYAKRERLGFKNYRSTISGTYMCSPKNTLFYNERNIIPQQYPSHNLTEKDIVIYKKIYGYDEKLDYIKNNDFIFIGSQFKDLSYMNEDYKKCGADEEKFLNITKDILKNNNLYIKRHPNTIGLRQSEIAANNIPIELLQLLNPLENKVIIALFSNVLFTSRLIFDKEPYIIFLYKAIGMNVEKVVKMSEDEFDSANKKILIDAYKSSKKVFIPKTEEEFVSNLSYIKTLIEKGK